MIRFPLKPEYLDFDRQVRTPGRSFLSQTPNPTSKQFKGKSFWNRALGELNAAYSGICAYTAMYLPDRGSVDHFKPKDLFPGLAYEWSNFRLAGAKINSTKGSSRDVLDPTEIGEDWFLLDLPSCLLRPNPELEREIRIKVSSTINTLRLNSDERYVEERFNILLAYAEGDVAFNFLERRYPFLAKEVRRQNVADGLSELFRL